VNISTYPFSLANLWRAMFVPFSLWRFAYVVIASQQHLRLDFV
jgi:hypothetical protein